MSFAPLWIPTVIAFSAISLILIVWIRFLGFYRHDWLSVVLSLGVAYIVAIGPTDKALEASSVATGFRIWGSFVVTFVITAWIVASIYSVALGRWRRRHGSQSLPRVGTETKIRIALALSGGGYRAALFHAGVLHKMHDLHIPISTICSVSGGSIVAGAYVTGTRPQEFVDLVASGMFNLKRELVNLFTVFRFLTGAVVRTLSQVGRISARKSLAGLSLEEDEHSSDIVVDKSILYRISSWCERAGSFSRTTVQADLLDRILFRGAKLADTIREDGPLLVVAATDILRPALIGITPVGPVDVQILPWIEDLIPRLENLDSPYCLGGHEGYHAPGLLVDAGEGLPTRFRLADLVAASGAFPVALKAVPMDERYCAAEGDFRQAEYLFADGGIADNYGIVLLQAANGVAREFWPPVYWPDLSSAPFARKLAWAQSRLRIDLVLASDGSAFPTLRTTAGLLQLPALIDAISDCTPGEEFIRRLGDYYSQHGPASPLKKRAEVLPLSLRPLVDHPIAPSQLVGMTATGLSSVGVGAFVVKNEEIVENYVSLMEHDLAAAAKATQGPRPGENRAPGRMDSKSTGQGSVSDLTLTQLIDLDFSRKLLTFINTSTLDDQPGARTADLIFRLGQQVALIYVNAIRETIAKLEAGLDAGSSGEVHNA